MRRERLQEEAGREVVLVGPVWLGIHLEPLGSLATKEARLA